jgi:hypothetical protein
VVEVQPAREEDRDRDVVVPQVAVPVAQAFEQESPSRALPDNKDILYTRWDELHVPWRRGHVLSWRRTGSLWVGSGERDMHHLSPAARRRRPRCRLPQGGVIWRRALLQPTYDVVTRDYLCGVKHW